jgi:hypothetical protein
MYLGEKRPQLVDIVGLPIVFIACENYGRYHFIVNENLWNSRWSKDQIRAMLLE